MPTPLSLLALHLVLLLQITTIIAHPLTKRKGGGGRGGGVSGTSGLHGGSASGKTVATVVGSILGALLLLFVIYRYCLPGGRMYEWMKRVWDERLAKKRARNEAGYANAGVNEGPGKAEMRGF